MDGKRHGPQHLNSSPWKAGYEPATPNRLQPTNDIQNVPLSAVDINDCNVLWITIKSTTVIHHSFNSCQMTTYKYPSIGYYVPFRSTNLSHFALSSRFVLVKMKAALPTVRPLSSDVSINPLPKRPPLNDPKWRLRDRENESADVFRDATTYDGTQITRVEMKGRPHKRMQIFLE